MSRDARSMFRWMARGSSPLKRRSATFPLVPSDFLLARVHRCASEKPSYDACPKVGSLLLFSRERSAHSRVASGGTAQRQGDEQRAELVAEHRRLTSSICPGSWGSVFAATPCQ